MKIGETVLGTVAHAYEPVLERYIGRRVIAEEFLGETDIAEHPGILKEYTAEWLELLDCQLAKEHNFDFSRPEKLQLNRNLDFVIHKSEAIPPTFKVTLENHGSEPVKVKKVEALDYVQPVDARLVPDGELTISLSDLPPDCFEGLDFVATPAQIELRAEDRQHYLQNESHTFPVLPPINIVIEAVREGDLCLPRSRGLVRHGAEAPAPGWLRAAWISLQNGVSIYGVQAYAFISWVLFNGFISGWFIWYVTRVVFGLGITISLACGILGGLIYGGLWAMQGSMAIQGERQIAQRLRRRLGGVSVLLIIGLAIYVAMG
jgi:hypothetical protein